MSVAHVSTPSTLSGKRGPTRLASWQHDVAYWLLLTLASYIFVCLYSHDPRDPSPFSAAFPPQSVTNLGGVFGAELSSVLIFLLGAAAYLVPMVLLAHCLFHVFAKGQSRPVWRLVGFGVTIISSSALLSRAFPDGTFGFAKKFAASGGGYLGQLVQNLTLKYSGQAGSAILLAFFSGVGLLLIVQRPFLSKGAGAAWEKTRKIKLRLPNLHWPGKGGKVPPSATVSQIPAVKIPKILAHANESFSAEPAVSAPTASPPKNREETVFRPSKIPSPCQEYESPSLQFFKMSSHEKITAAEEDEIRQTAQLLVKTLEDFGVKGQIVTCEPGPVVTVYEFELEAGIKQARVTSLVDDLALALRVDSIFVLPVKNKRALGIQVPNRTRQIVRMGDVLRTQAFQESSSALSFALGKSLNGDPVVVDLTAMPHLLIAGATGSGKSVAINSLLCSVIMKASPANVRMILVDPKMLELSVYEGIPHLLMPVITEPKRASLAVHWAACEMERRYRLMQTLKVRHIDAFNEAWQRLTYEQRLEILDGLEGPKDRSSTAEPLPYILVVIDELADLMLTAPKDVESSIQRLAQKARAAGIHLVLATQRPSVDIITGVIKANLPYRVAFQVVSRHDSRTILDQGGADNLLGKGDLLFMKPGLARLERVQGSFISDDEVNQVVSAVTTTNGPPQYDESIMTWIDREVDRRASTEGLGIEDFGAMDGDDPRMEAAAEIAEQHGTISASFLQRQLKIGYNRAARIVENMEQRGWVSPPDGSRPRQWLGRSSHAS